MKHIFYLIYFKQNRKDRAINLSVKSLSLEKANMSNIGKILIKIILLIN